MCPEDGHLTFNHERQKADACIVNVTIKCSWLHECMYIVRDRTPVSNNSVVPLLQVKLQNMRSPVIDCPRDNSETVIKRLTSHPVLTVTWGSAAISSRCVCRKEKGCHDWTTWQGLWQCFPFDIMSLVFGYRNCSIKCRNSRKM